MIFLRNNNSIIGIISRNQLGILNPLQWSGKLETESYFLNNFIGLDSLYEVFPITETYGYGFPPKKYYIKTGYSQEYIYIYLDHSQDIIWFNGRNKEGQVVHIEVSSESMVLLRILGDRLSYNDGNNEIIIDSCTKKPISSSVVNICFYDKYGLPQLGTFPVGNYNFSSAFEDEFESVNYGVKYYSTIKPYALMEIGDESISEEFRNYYEGLCTNNPIYVYDKDRKAVVGSIYDSSITANYYGKNLSFTATLNLTCHDDYDSIIFR